MCVHGNTHSPSSSLELFLWSIESGSSNRDHSSCRDTRTTPGCEMSSFRCSLKGRRLSPGLVTAEVHSWKAGRGNGRRSGLAHGKNPKSTTKNMLLFLPTRGLGRADWLPLECFDLRSPNPGPVTSRKLQLCLNFPVGD